MKGLKAERSEVYKEKFLVLKCRNQLSDQERDWATEHDVIDVIRLMYVTKLCWD